MRFIQCVLVISTRYIILERNFAMLFELKNNDYQRLVTAGELRLFSLITTQKKVDNYENLVDRINWLEETLDFSEQGMVSVHTLQQRVNAIDRWIKWQYNQIDFNDPKIAGMFFWIVPQSRMFDHYAVIDSYLDIFGHFPSPKKSSQMGQAYELSNVIAFLKDTLKHASDGEPMAEIRWTTTA